MEEISQLIHQRTGIQLGAKQVSMVESRLKRRFYELGLSEMEEYQRHFREHREEEIEALVSLLTTHHTFFFREFVQFEFLAEQLPAMVARARARGAKQLEIYSAACSRGQEVYSLAMHLKQHLREVAPDFTFRILGSDVDSQSVAVAQNGVYRRDEIKSVPISYLGDHWARGTGEIADFVKAKKSLRDHCEFATVNLMDLKGTEGRKFDAIFCRNVFIYFTPVQIKAMTQGLLAKLHEGGLFFVGVSESLHGSELPIRGVGASVYSPNAHPKSSSAAAPASAPGSASASPRAAAPAPKPAPVPAPISAPMPDPLRVLCVDDSPSILALLKKILTKEHGFEVVGTAVNGLEAEAALKQHRPHVMTLDIHMPVRTGVEFLEKTTAAARPPVVMVTSVSRDDADLAWKTLELGAADYVEKPALNNLNDRADEIRAKLRAAYRAKQKPVSRTLDKQFARATAIADPAAVGVLCVFSLGELAECGKLLKELAALKVHVRLAVEGADAILPSVAERLTREAGVAVSSGDGAICLGALKSGVDGVRGKGAVSVMVLGEISKHGAEAVLALSGAQLLLSDLGGGKATAPLAELASDILPSSSFAYLLQQFCAEKAKARGKG